MSRKNYLDSNNTEILVKYINIRLKNIVGWTTTIILISLAVIHTFSPLL